MVIHRYAILIMRDKGERIFLMDSHSKNTDGMMAVTGTSVLLGGTMLNLLHHIHALVESIGLSSDTFLKPCQF